MKKLKVKNILLITILITTIFGLSVANNNMTNNAIEKCVNAGNEYNYCVEGLR